MESTSHHARLALMLLVSAVVQEGIMIFVSCVCSQGEVLYRVRWKNYCSDDDTWEPEAHLEDCREVLLAFKKTVAEAKAKKEAEAKKSVVSVYLFIFLIIFWAILLY